MSEIVEFTEVGMLVFNRTSELWEENTRDRRQIRIVGKFVSSLRDGYLPFTTQISMNDGSRFMVHGGLKETFERIFPQ